MYRTQNLIDQLRAAAADVPNLQARVALQLSELDRIGDELAALDQTYFGKEAERVDQMLNRWAVEGIGITKTVTCTQCMVCGHIEAPAVNLHTCPACNQVGADVRPFTAEMEVA